MMELKRYVAFVEIPEFEDLRFGGIEKKRDEEIRALTLVKYKRRRLEEKIEISQITVCQRGNLVACFHS